MLLFPYEEMRCVCLNLTLSSSMCPSLRTLGDVLLFLYPMGPLIGPSGTMVGVDEPLDFLTKPLAILHGVTIIKVG